MPHAEITVQNAVGLHARPAAAFVRLASSFPAVVKVQKLGDPAARPANAKSILAVLSLGVNQNDQIAIDTDGEKAEEALNALVDLVRANFGEGTA